MCGFLAKLERFLAVCEEGDGYDRRGVKTMDDFSGRNCGFHLPPEGEEG